MFKHSCRWRCRTRSRALGTVWNQKSQVRHGSHCRQIERSWTDGFGAFGCSIQGGNSVPQTLSRNLVPRTRPHGSHAIPITIVIVDGMVATTGRQPTEESPKLQHLRLQHLSHQRSTRAMRGRMQTQQSRHLTRSRHRGRRLRVVQLSTVATARRPSSRHHQVTKTMPSAPFARTTN